MRVAFIALVMLALGPRVVAAQSATPAGISAVLVDRDVNFVPDRLGDTVVITGTVTTRPRGTHDQWRFVLVQDDSGGIRMAGPADEKLIDRLQPGDVIRATGVLQQFRGAAELRALRIERDGATSVPHAHDVRVADAASERYEGRRVRVVGQLSRRARDGGVEFELRDGSGGMAVHLPARLLESTLGSRLLLGGHVDMVAIVSQADREPPFDSDYRLAPAEPEDIRFVARPPYARIALAFALALLLVIVLLAVRGRRAAERRAAEVGALYENLKRKDEALQESIERKNDLEDRLRQSQKMEAVGLLAGGVAHDFNNLLTVISNYSAMLLEENGASGPIAGDLKEINAAADRAARLTQQLLAFSRKQLLKPRTVDVNALCLGLVPMLRCLVGEDIRIATVSGARVGSVLADPGQLEQVIVNLVVNARDAMPGGGTVTIETAAAPLDRSETLAAGYEAPAGDYVRICVSDTGMGMDATTQARIFEPFFTTKAPGKGTGLGLATVYGIVKQSGGFVLARSEIGRGSTFSVYLPQTGATSTVETAPIAEPPPFGSETVLVVEDEVHVQRLVTKALTRQGYTVVSAESAAEAITLAADERQPIDLVLTDIVMPEMNGVAMAEAIRARNPGLRVIFMSGYTDDEIVRRGLLDAEMIFLQKPFTVGTLSRTVRDVLDARPGGASVRLSRT